MDFARLIIPECAQMRGDCFSSNKLKVLIISTIVISTVMTSVVAAPAPHNLRHRRQLLNNTCSAVHVNGTMKNNEPRGLEILLVQMNLTIADFKYINRTYISPLYKHVAKLSKQISDNKLPRMQFEMYKDFRKNHIKMNKEKTISILLPQLFSGLHTYGVAFRKLHDMKPHTYSATFKHTERKIIIQHIMDQHRALMCELETSFEDTETINKHKTKHNFNSDIDWPEHPDLTRVHTRDYSVFTEYNNFLQDWRKILRQINSIGQHKKQHERTARRTPLQKNGKLRKKIKTTTT